MRLRELRTQIEQIGGSLLHEKAYPVTSDWIPVPDTLALIDRFEKDLRRDFGSSLSNLKSYTREQLIELLQRINNTLFE